LSICLRNWRFEEISKVEKSKEKQSSRKKKLSDSFFRIIRMIKKEFRLLRTDPFNLLIALVIPPLIIVLFSFMSTVSASNPIPIRCVIVTYDSDTFINPNNFTETKIDTYAAPYVDAVNQSEVLELVDLYNATEEIYAMEQARTDLIRKRIKLIITIPLDFSEMLTWGLPGILQCNPDASEIESIQNILNAVQDSINIFIRENNLTPQFFLQGFEEFAIPPDYNSDYNGKIIMMLPIMTFGIALVLSILVIVKEKPIARLLLTPIQRTEILLSKYVTYSLILLLQVLLLVITSLSTGLYLAGTPIDLFGSLFMLGFTGIALGLFISSISKTKTEANQLFFAFFIIIVLLSGIFVPLDSMPTYLQIIAYILPLSHGDPMIRGILTKGNSVIGFHFYWLVAISAVLFFLSFIIFIKRKYEV